MGKEEEPAFRSFTNQLDKVPIGHVPLGILAGTLGWEALEPEHRTVCCLFRFLLLTAQRNEETRLAEWADIEDGLWRIPVEHAKNNRPHKVPLSPQALAVLESLRDGQTPFVFESPSKKSDGPVLWLGRVQTGAKAVRVPLHSPRLAGYGS